MYICPAHKFRGWQVCRALDPVLGQAIPHLLKLLSDERVA